MASNLAHEAPLPADPALATFTNGEKALGGAADLNADAYTTLWFARRMYLPPGKYTLTIIGDDAVTFRIGSDFKSSRIVASNRFSDGPASVLFHVMPDETRLDILVANLNNAVAPCYVVFSIARDGKLVYASAAQDWRYDTTPIPDAELDGDVDPLDTTPVFTVLPNWRDGVTERLSWMTDVLDGETGAEQRRSLRDFPRRSFEATFVRAGENRARLDNFVAGIGRKTCFVPLWHEQYRVPVSFGLSDSGVSLPVGTVANREFRVGTRVLVTNGNPSEYEVAQIETLNLSTGAITWMEPLALAWPAGTRIIPLRAARITEQAQMTALTDRAAQMPLRFDLIDPDDQFADPADYPDTTALSAPSWGADVPLFHFKPNWSTLPTMDFDRTAFTLDNQIGTPDIIDPSQQVRISQKLNLLLRGRESVFSFRRFIAQARGRALRFYMPSFMHDLVPTSALAGAYFDCRPAGFAALHEIDQSARKVIEIVLRDGTKHYRTITDVLPVNDGPLVAAERFYVDTALPVIQPTDIARIQWMVTARFDQDTFELHHHVDDSAAVTVAVVTRSVDSDGMEPLE